MSVLFQLSSLTVMPFWMLMIFAPRWQWTRRVMQSAFVALAPALVYAALVLPHVGHLFPILANPTLASVTSILSSPFGVTVAWVHFLAFDLLIGRWVYLDSIERDLPTLAMIPLLFATFMFGPLGFATYLVYRECYSRLISPSVLESKAEQGSWSVIIDRLNVGSLTLLVGCVFGLLFDHRVIGGSLAWIKPTKFALSGLVFAYSISWILRGIDGEDALKKRLATIIATVLTGEYTFIVLQVFRGVRSHFNSSTPFDSVVYSIMGIMISVLAASMFPLIVAIFRQKARNPILAESVRWGLIGTVIGMLVAILMTAPSPWTFHQYIAAVPHGSVGAHTVGAFDGGPGLPFVGWSTVAGDLRIAHFVGLHALQVLPFVGWVLGLRRFSFLSEWARVQLVKVAGGMYIAFTLLVTAQALRGQSAIHPDTLTISLFISILVFALLASKWVLKKSKLEIASSAGGRLSVS